jgi:uncharacterized membrane protein
MSKKSVQWLYGELPLLVANGVVPAGIADRLREHYGAVERRSGRRIALTVCSILGALLIGSGVILLLAHNWTQLSRPARTVLALAPLLATQALAVFGIYTGKRSAAWRESVAIFLSLAVGASISLIGQTYHIPGDPGAFMMTWMLLIAPLIYLLGATAPCLMYLAGITAWAGYSQSTAGHALTFWPLLALVVPHVLIEYRKNPYSVRSCVLGWGVAFCLCVATGIVLEKVVPGLWIVVYSALFAVMYLAGSYWFGESPSVFQKPLQIVGLAGIVVLTFIFTYEWPWREIGWSHYRYRYGYFELAAWTDYLLVAGLPFGCASLLAMSVRRGHAWRILYGVMPVVAVLGYMLAALDVDENVCLLLFNLYMFALGIGTITWGVRDAAIGVVNAGMVILTVLIVARFFDSDLGLIARGVAFILIGIGFLVTNLILIKRGKPRAQTEQE